MRLLDARTVTLKSFQSENEVPRYAILSHTWGPEEVSFDDLNDNNTRRKLIENPTVSYGKIAETCRTAREDGLHYVWVDTCCIDKSSSSELSETINSMFKWYKAATKCYAYLQDVEESDAEMFRETSGMEGNADLCLEQEARIRESRFATSKWWTRGWTLQELIAPDDLIFFARGRIESVDYKKWLKERNEEDPTLRGLPRFFVRIGSKKEFVRVVNIVSGIDEAILLQQAKLEDVCVATKMSWAADRKTTRIEDIAYSLLGIFGINMAMLYGEGDRAFIRLQEEIIKSTNDHSIFAWNGRKYQNGSLFAPQPSCFKGTARIVSLPRRKNEAEFSLTNAGLDIQLRLYKSNIDVELDREGRYSAHRCWVAPLACRYESDFSGPIALEVEETEDSGAMVIHRRSERLFVVDSRAREASLNESSVTRLPTHKIHKVQLRSVLIRQVNATAEPKSRSDGTSSLHVLNKKCVIQWSDYGKFLKGRECYPLGAWNRERSVMWVKRGASVMGALSLLTHNGMDLLLIMGFEREESIGAVTWGKEWVRLESCQMGMPLHDFCKMFREEHGLITERRIKQVANLSGTLTRIEAKIYQGSVLEEDVFIVKIAVQERTVP